MEKGGVIFGVVLFLIIILAAIYSAYKSGISILEAFKNVLFSSWAWLLMLATGLSLMILSPMLYAVSPTSAKKWFLTAKIGTAILAFSVIVFVYQVVIPLFELQPIKFETCATINLNDPLNAILCAFFGYQVPKEVSNTFSISSLLIASFIIPFGFFFWVYKDMMEGLDYPGPRARGVLSFIGAYATMRSFMATDFINFFYYGWAGIGAEFFAVLLVAFLWGGIRKPFKGAIERGEMKKFWDVVSGRKSATLKEFLSLIKKHPAPYDFLNSSEGLDALTRVAKMYGAERIVDEIKAELLNINPHSRDRHQKIRQVLERIISSL